jgi:putative flippase GtrA
MTTVLDPPAGPPPVDDPDDDSGGRPRPAVAVDVVVPVYNEETDLGPSVRRLHAYLSDVFPVSWRITIADNASTDATPAVANQLAHQLPGVRVVRLNQKGRGLALRRTWMETDATVVAYMDVDLSTDLAALLPLVAPLLSGHSDVAIGSRLSRGSRVVRGAKREVISRCYNLLLRTTLRARFSDAQCGFKAMRADRARILLPHVQDTGWFFDTELLVLAERAGLRIHEVPVDWVDDPDSRVDILSTAMADLLGIARLGRGLITGSLPMAELRAASTMPDGAGTPVADGVPPALPGQLGRFAVIGVLSTAAYILLYVLMRASFGAQLSNAIALLVTAIANTAANRRFTFSQHGRDGAVRHQAEGLVVFALGLGVSSGALALVHAMDPRPATAVELAALVTANLVSTVLRFVMLKSWVFHPGRGTGVRRLTAGVTEGRGR